MISLLQAIVDFFVCWVMTALVTVANMFLAAIGALIAGLMLLLPDMPDMPDVPTGFDGAVGTAFGWVAWVFPVGTAVQVLGFVITAWLVWQLVAIALRWAKAI